MRLDGKVAIVTGGSRGIGRAICLGLGEAGASVVVASRTEEDRSAGTEYEKYGSGDIRATAEQITAEGRPGATGSLRRVAGSGYPEPGGRHPGPFRANRRAGLQRGHGLRISGGGSGRGAFGPMPGRERARSAAALQVRVAGHDLPGRRRIHILRDLRIREELPRGQGWLFDEQSGAGADVFQPSRGGQAAQHRGERAGTGPGGHVDEPARGLAWNRSHTDGPTR